MAGQYALSGRRKRRRTPATRKRTDIPKISPRWSSNLEKASSEISSIRVSLAISMLHPCGSDSVWVCLRTGGFARRAKNRKRAHYYFPQQGLHFPAITLLLSSRKFVHTHAPYASHIFIFMNSTSPNIYLKNSETFANGLVRIWVALIKKENMKSMNCRSIPYFFILKPMCFY